MSIPRTDDFTDPIISSNGIETLIEKVREMLADRPHPLVVALDGRGGAGKSTLSARLARECGGVVVHGDNFYVGSRDGSVAQWNAASARERADTSIDWPRLRREALEPLLAGQTASYRRFDWEGWAQAQREGALQAKIGLGATVITDHPAPVIVLDGVYSTRPELADLIDLKILIEVPNNSQWQRLMQRNGADFMADWETRWAESEDYYFTHIRPRSSFDFVIANPQIVKPSSDVFRKLTSYSLQYPRES